MLVHSELIVFQILSKCYEENRMTGIVVSPTNPLPAALASYMDVSSSPFCLNSDLVPCYGLEKQQQMAQGAPRKT